MPLYEFYCPDCHRIFNFFSRTVNTTKRPMCPHCKKRRLQRQVSQFALTKPASAETEGDDMEFNPHVEEALDSVMQEAEGIDENDPRQAAQLMRTFADKAGMKFKGSIEEAIARMEAGEDPERIEQEMGELVDEEEMPFEMAGSSTAKKRITPPVKDDKLYDL